MVEAQPWESDISQSIAQKSSGDVETDAARGDAPSDGARQNHPFGRARNDRREKMSAKSVHKTKATSCASDEAVGGQITPANTRAILRALRGAPSTRVDLSRHHDGTKATASNGIVRAAASKIRRIMRPHAPPDRWWSIIRPKHPRSNPNTQMKATRYDLKNCNGLTKPSAAVARAAAPPTMSPAATDAIEIRGGRLVKWGASGASSL